MKTFSRQRSKRNAHCWWIHPVAVVLCMQLPLVILAHALSEETYESFWHTQKFLDSTTLLLSLGSIVAILVGYSLGRLLSVSGRNPRRPILSYRLLLARLHQPLRQCFAVCLSLTWVGSILWLGFAIARGLNLATLKDFLLQQVGTTALLKEKYFATVPGVTTLAQFGMAAVILGFLSNRGQNRQKTNWAIICLLGLVTVRSFLLSERLALIEVAIPLTILVIDSKMRDGVSRKTKRLLNWAPVVGIATVYLVFTAFEMFRSWTYYSRGAESSLAWFGAVRLTGYYATAVNNSGLILTRLASTTHFPIFTQQWLWKMPVIKNLMGDGADSAISAYGALLHTWANREFNNPGGLLLPFWDFGVIGGLLYWLLFGMFISFAYRSFRSGELLGFLLYPLCYVGLLELSRVLYLSDGRSFPSLVFLGFAAFFLKGRRLVNRIDRPALPNVPVGYPIADPTKLTYHQHI
jgi:hypothetical protein